MKRYNILNNSIGWACFVIAAVTYMLTLEPTASFWDCPEFILQGFKLEVGHPPGNPIFMLAARFFANFAFGDVTKVALMVNAMSGLLSAATILLLFWTITHLVKKLIVKDEATGISPAKMLVIFGSGICGALMYAWSDTFWFSAVEGEVYAFSSFCTALVFWLILKWENRADRPDSDKYLILIAYVIGISIAVHLLNLLCIPAIVLVVYYKKTKTANVKGSIMALLVSFAIVALILYGLVPGFIEVAQSFELFCVNTLGMSFNMGVLIYTIVLVASFAWTLFNLYHYRKVKPALIKTSFVISILLSGILFIGQSWIVPVVLLAALIVYLAKVKKLPVRILSLTSLSILVIFVGYASYALLLIRSSAHTPMNQNAPDNVFALSSYLNREQYGERPLIYGETYYSPYAKIHVRDAAGNYNLKVTEGSAEYAREVKENSSDPDRYHLTGHKQEIATAPELDMLLPRMYSPSHISSYDSWICGLSNRPVSCSIVEDEQGNVIQTQDFPKPTFAENLRYFFVYQLNHMYWRYFMWNFAGRQNELQGQGETTHGNWISGIPFIDNPRLGDQSLLPDDLGKGNKGHNVFFMIPLIMGLIGLYWQATCSRRGVEQFWVIFFLFFMTGIAIVLYLNQVPDQPRERDYAFAGSFYAYAIWVGMGVAGLWHAIRALSRNRKTDKTPVECNDDPESDSKAYRRSLTGAVIAAVVGVIVPLQVVSQTWDDHDRSGRYTARDFGMNYLNSLDPNAIIFTYGDNDTFPLWYAQEVEGVRTDVKVVNLSYFTTDWYIDQLRRQSYEAPGIKLQAQPKVYAYNSIPFFSFLNASDSLTNATTALAEAYSKKDFDSELYQSYIFKYPNVYIPANGEAALREGRVKPGEKIEDIRLGLKTSTNPRSPGGIGINHVMILDLLNTNANDGWKRPVYFATTVPSDNYIGLEPYFNQTGMAYEVTPVVRGQGGGVNTDKMYRNITERWRWGGLDKAKDSKDIYLDETVRRMVTSHRSSMFDLALGLAYDGIERQMLADTTDAASTAAIAEYVADRRAKADTILQLQHEKLSENVMPYTVFELDQLLGVYEHLYYMTQDEAYLNEACEMMEKELERYAQYVRYYQSLSPTYYSLLSRQDRLTESYFIQLLRRYNDFGGDGLAMSDKLQKEFGIDLDRYIPRGDDSKTDAE